MFGLTEKISQAIAIGLAVALLAAVGWAGWAEVRAAHAKAGEARAVAEVERIQGEHVRELAAAVELARAQERRVQDGQRKVIDAEVVKSQALEADVARSAAVAVGLRDALAAERARGAEAAANSSASPECQAAGTARAMLADMLQQCSERRRELARYADRARIAGETCVGSYEALTPADGQP